MTTTTTTTNASEVSNHHGMENSSNSPIYELIHAVMNGHYEEVDSILQKHSSSLVNEMDPRTGYTPLCRACCYGHMDILYLLLDKYSANVANCMNYSATTTTPLHIATMKGYPSMIRLLLHYHQKQQQQEQQQQQQIQEVPQQQQQNKNEPDNAVLFHNLMYPIQNTNDHSDHSSIAATIRNKNNQTTDHRSSIINVKNNVGWTPLYMATLYHNEVLVSLLLQFGADVTIAEHKDGDTPLHLACKHGYYTIIQLLLSYANNRIFDMMLSIKNHHEQLSQDIIRLRNDSAIIQLFQKEISLRTNRYNIYSYLTNQWMMASSSSLSSEYS